MMLFYSRKIAYIAAFLLLTLSLGLMAAYRDYSKKTISLDQSATQITQRIDQMKKEISLKPFNKKFGSAFSFVNELYYNKKAPAFKTIIHDIEIGSFSSAKIKNLKITYTDKIATAEVYGTIKLDFDNAYKGYQILVKNLENKGYDIIENSFNTQIDRSEFRLIFNRSIL